MQTILKKKKVIITNRTTLRSSVCTNTVHREKKGVSVVIAGLSGFYTKSEIDTKLNDLNIWYVGQW